MAPVSGFRVVFLACLAIAALAAPTPARVLAPGSLKARWPIKTTVPSNAQLGHAHEVQISDLLGLQDVPGVASQDAQYRNLRIPTPVNGLHEGDIIRTRGWVHLIAMDDDGDYHIQMSDSPTTAARCLIVELPMDQAKFEKDPALRARSATERKMLRAKLLHDATQEPLKGGNLMQHPPYMVVAGQLFFDDWHVGGGKRGLSKKNHPMKASTLWEIHPVTDIGFAPVP